jgi:hypothetical protein
MDNTNPYDCADQFNRFIPHEVAGQVILTSVLLLARSWFSALVEMAFAIYLVIMFRGKKLHMHPVDVYKQLKPFKRRASWVLTFQCIFFLFFTIRCVKQRVPQ